MRSSTDDVSLVRSSSDEVSLVRSSSEVVSLVRSFTDECDQCGADQWQKFLVTGSLSSGGEERK